MPQPLRVVEQEDPRDIIRKSVGWVVDMIEPLGAGVLLVVYERGKQQGDVKTAGGIIVPEMKNGSLAEDKLQGKAALVMKLGPIAFRPDADHDWGDRIPNVGDWVIVDIRDAWGFDLPGDRRARLVQDVDIKAVVARPDVVW